MSLSLLQAFLLFSQINQTGFVVPTDDGGLEPTPTPVPVATPPGGDEIALAAAATFVEDAEVCRCCSCGDAL